MSTENQIDPNSPTPVASGELLNALPHARAGCACRLCETGKKFKAITSKLSEEDAKWMLAYYEYSFEQEAELEMIKASQESARARIPSRAEITAAPDDREKVKAAWRRVLDLGKLFEEMSQIRTELFRAIEEARRIEHETGVVW